MHSSRCTHACWSVDMLKRMFDSAHVSKGSQTFDSGKGVELKMLESKWDSQTEVGTMSFLVKWPRRIRVTRTSGGAFRSIHLPRLNGLGS